MEIESYCIICNDGNVHKVEKMVFDNNRYARLTLDCGHVKKIEFVSITIGD